MKIILTSAFLLLNCILFSQNKGLSFNQLNNNYIITPNNSSINVTNNFTIEFWIQPSKTEIWAVILQEGKCSNSSSSYNVAINADSTISFTFNCNGNCNYANSYKCNTKIQPGVCLHVAISYSTTGVQFYFNGILQPGQYTTGSYCGSIKNSSEPLQIGVYKFLDGSLGSYYDGLIDELRIWGRVLTQVEILANFQEPLIGNESELRLYYTFDESIIGNGSSVINHEIITGTALNGLTYSTNSSTPNTSYSCFNYTSTTENNTNNDIIISIYPNPTTNKITISNSKDITKIEIYNNLGEIKYENSDCKAFTTFDIDISNYVNGIYLLKTYTKNTISYNKILKQ